MSKMLFLIFIGFIIALFLTYSVIKLGVLALLPFVAGVMFKKVLNILEFKNDEKLKSDEL